MDDCRAGAAIIFRSETVGVDARMLREKGVNRVAQLTDPFSVNNTQVVNSPLEAFSDEFLNDLLYISGPEGVQIQNTIDRQLHSFGYVTHRLTIIRETP